MASNSASPVGGGSSAAAAGAVLGFGPFAISNCLRAAKHAWNRCGYVHRCDTSVITRFRAHTTGDLGGKCGHGADPPAW